jgi:hypothetical protein
MPISDRSAFVSLGAFFMVISLRESVLIQNGMEASRLALSEPTHHKKMEVLP